MHFKRTLRRIWLILFTITPAVLLVLPADFFDHGRSICISVLLFDQTCYGCGMTRAIQHLIHGDLFKAWEFNKLSVIVLPLLIIIWWQEIRPVRNTIRNAARKKDQ